jgi:hypothetical protein
MRIVREWKGLALGVTLGMAAAFFLIWIKPMQAAEQAAWMQAIVSVIAAGVAIWAVRQPILASERMRVRALEDAKKDRAHHASMLAGIWLDDLFDTVVRLRVAQYFLDEAADPRLMVDVLADLSRIAAPTFLRSVERIELFERSDGILFGIAANRILGLHRMGQVNLPLASEWDKDMAIAWWNKAQTAVADGVQVVASAYSRSVAVSKHGVDYTQQAFDAAANQFPEAKRIYLQRITTRTNFV